MRDLFAGSAGLLTSFACLFVGLEGARAEAVSPASSDCTQLAQVMAFVSEQTGLPPLQACPHIAKASNAELRSSVALSRRPAKEEPLAVFLPVEAEILLSREIALTDPLGRSYLVHELVHALQYANGLDRHAPCPGWLEGQAYRVQAAYLRHEGHTASALDFELLSLLQGACAQPY